MVMVVGFCLGEVTCEGVSSVTTPRDAVEPDRTLRVVVPIPEVDVSPCFILFSMYY